MTVAETLRLAAEILPEIELLVLFGSLARGVERPRSDVDIGVRVRNQSPAARRTGAHVRVVREAA